MVTILEGFAPPQNAGLSPRDATPDWARTIDLMMDAGTPLAMFGLYAAFFIALVAPIFTIGTPKLMTGLDVQARSEVLDAMLKSKIFFVRELSMLLKIAASMALLGCEPIRAQSHYDDATPERRRDRRIAAKTLPTLPVLPSRKEVA
jgi:hypothetical protein